MATLESRITKLESATPASSGAFETLVRYLSPLNSHGAFAWDEADAAFAELIRPWLADLGSKSRQGEDLADAVERGLADILVTFNDSHDPFAYERYRGQVPDRVLAAIYAGMRNFAFKPDVALRVRTLAGLEANNVNS
jgi:hypothetical protein